MSATTPPIVAHDPIEAARRSGLAAANRSLLSSLASSRDPELRDRLYDQFAQNCAAMGVRMPDLTVFPGLRPPCAS